MADKHDGDSGFGLQDFFKDLVRSFVPAAYPQLAARPASSNALYLLGVVFLVILLLTPLLYRFQERRLAAQRAHYEQVLPEALYFENSEAHYEGEQPYVHVEKRGDTRIALIIDTTGQTTEIPDEYDYGTLFTNKVIVHKVDAGSGRTERIEGPIPETAGRISARQFYLDEIEKEKWVNFALGVGHLFLFAVVLLFILATLAAALCFGLAALRSDDRLPFGTCFGVATHGATPVAFMTVSGPLAPTPIVSYLVFGLPLVLFALLVMLGARACQQDRETSSEEAPKARRRK